MESKKTKVSRKCFVPSCKNTVTSEKIFVTVPRKNRDKWIEAVGRDSSFSRLGMMVCCEDHLDMPNDVVNFTEFILMGREKVSRLYLKKGALPRYNLEGSDKSYEVVQDSLPEVEDNHPEHTEVQDITDFQLTYPKHTYSRNSKPQGCNKDGKTKINLEYSEDEEIETKEEPLFTQEEPKKEIKQESEEIELECAIDIKKAYTEEKIYVWSSFTEQEGSSILRNKSFKCDICDSMFTCSSRLKEHNRTHTGEKPFKCNICKVTFRHLSTLRHHIRIHTEEKPFKCGICDSTFKFSHRLKEHIITHTGEKPFKCNICDSAFTRSWYLKEHVKTHIGEKPFKCVICKDVFAKSNNLKQHLRTHTRIIVIPLKEKFKCNTNSQSM